MIFDTSGFYFGIVYNGRRTPLRDPTHRDGTVLYSKIHGAYMQLQF